MHRKGKENKQTGMDGIQTERLVKSQNNWKCWFTQKTNVTHTLSINIDTIIINPLSLSESKEGDLVKSR